MVVVVVVFVVDAAVVVVVVVVVVIVVVENGFCVLLLTVAYRSRGGIFAGKVWATRVFRQHLKFSTQGRVV